MKSKKSHHLSVYELETQESQWYGSVQVWRPENPEHQGRQDICSAQAIPQERVDSSFLQLFVLFLGLQGIGWCPPTLGGKVAFLNPPIQMLIFSRTKWLNHWIFLFAKYIDSDSTLTVCFLLVNSPYSQF